MAKKHQSLDKGPNGRFISTLVCGRKFCRSCGHWKLSVYFHPRRGKNGKEYPAAFCESCVARKVKIYRKRRSPDQRIRENERTRLREERRRRAQGIPPRKFRNRDEVQDIWPIPGKVVGEYFFRWITHREEGVKSKEESGKRGVKTTVSLPFINGVRASAEDTEYLRSLQRGRVRYVAFDRGVDLCDAYQLPLWELEEEAKSQNRHP